MPLRVAYCRVLGLIAEGSFEIPSKSAVWFLSRIFIKFIESAVWFLSRIFIKFIEAFPTEMDLVRGFQEFDEDDSGCMDLREFNSWMDKVK
ncbi:hypothetical protein T484DRAFT_1814710 [Baffinella frigidus]|nr:hypothetical protein T484DRAFT_1814710 [Cryptophyta sp. CCMP2293]